MALLGDAPAFQGLPRPVALTRARAQRILDPNAPQQEEEQAAAAGADAADAMAADEQEGDAEGAAEGQDAAMDVDKAAEEQPAEGGGQEKQQQQAEAEDPIAAWSGRLLGVLQARFNLDNKPFSTEQVLLWMEQEQVRRV
jgi:hypothetical protein